MTARRRTREDPPPAGRLHEGALKQVLGYQLVRAAIVANDIFEREVGEPMALKPVEYTVLMLAVENPGGSLAQMARALSVTPPHITAIVDRLEQRGLVARLASDQDRRALVLSVTAAGAALARKATERIVAAEEAALPLTQGEQAILAELLQKVGGARDAARENGDNGRPG